MLNGQILFQIEIPYEHEHYYRLKNLCVGEIIKTGNGKYIWTFKIQNIEDVIKTLNKQITFNKEDAEAIISRVNIVSKKIELPEFKGKSGYEVIAFPKIYKIIEYRKIEEDDGIKTKELTHTIPVENVKALWDVMKKYPVGKEIQTSTVAENYCEKIGISKYYAHQSGSFCFRTFFGSRTKGYFPFYYSLKVLQYYGVIIHHLYGTIERRAENWEHQATLISECE